MPHPPRNVARMTDGLTDSERAILAFELIDEGAALEHDPMLVKRLRRLRDRRDATRLARASGTPS